MDVVETEKQMDHDIPRAYPFFPFHRAKWIREVQAEDFFNHYQQPEEIEKKKKEKKTKSSSLGCCWTTNLSVYHEIGGAV